MVGLDVDAGKVEMLNAGRGYLKHVDTGDLSELVKAGSFQASSNFADVATCDAVVVCVPTPLNRHREPDLSYVLQTGRSVGPHLRRGAAGCVGVHDVSGNDRGGFKDCD